jgi:hypothetical protein
MMTYPEDVMASPSNSAPERRDWSEPKQATVIPAQQARQGATGHNVRYVLGFGLAGAIIAFAVLYYFYFG